MTTKIDFGELADEVLEARGGRAGRCRVPDSLRQRVVDAVAAHRASGGRAKDAIVALGVHEVTFYRWVQELGEASSSAKTSRVTRRSHVCSGRRTTDSVPSSR